jgi:hypothetical protein
LRSFAAKNKERNAGKFPHDEEAFGNWYGLLVTAPLGWMTEADVACGRVEEGFLSGGGHVFEADGVAVGVDRFGDRIRG